MESICTIAGVVSSICIIEQPYCRQNIDTMILEVRLPAFDKWLWVWTIQLW